MGVPIENGSNAGSVGTVALQLRRQKNSVLQRDGAMGERGDQELVPSWQVEHDGRKREKVACDHVMTFFSYAVNRSFKIKYNLANNWVIYNILFTFWLTNCVWLHHTKSNTWPRCFSRSLLYIGAEFGPPLTKLNLAFHQSRALCVDWKGNLCLQAVVRTCTQKDDLIIERQFGEMRDSLCPLH